jgi:hypothetical protein
MYRKTESELSRLLEFHENIINDSRRKAAAIKNTLASRKAARKHKERLKHYAALYSDKAYDGNIERLIPQIQQDLSCGRTYARQILNIAVKMTKKEEINRRNARIVLMADFMSKTDIAKREGLTRQQVHNILKNAD